MNKFISRLFTVITVFCLLCPLSGCFSKPESVAETPGGEQATNPENSPGFSADWEDLQFILDGKSFALPFKLDELLALGWQIADKYDFTTMDGRTKTFGNIDLVNPKYETKIDVGLINLDKDEKSLADCTVIDIFFHAGYQGKKSHPEVTVFGGLTLGDSLEKIQSVFGSQCSVISASYVTVEGDGTRIAFPLYEEEATINDIELYLSYLNLPD